MDEDVRGSTEGRRCPIKRVGIVVQFARWCWCPGTEGQGGEVGRGGGALGVMVI